MEAESIVLEARQDSKQKKILFGLDLLRSLPTNYPSTLCLYSFITLSIDLSMSVEDTLVALVSMGMRK